MKKIKTIIFDFDKTLYLGEKVFTDRWVKYCNDLLKHYFSHLTEQEYKELFTKNNVPYMLECIQKDFLVSDYAKRIFLNEGYNVEDWINYLHTNVYEDNYDYVTKVMPNEMIKELSSEYTLYIISNSPVVQVEAFAKSLGIDLSPFKQVYTNFLTRNRENSEKDMYYNIILEREGIAPQECVMVGDSYEHDIVPSINLGLHTIYIDNQNYDYNDIMVKLNQLEQ